MWPAVKLIDVCEKITQGPNPKYDGVPDKYFRVLKTKHLYDDVIHYEEADCVSEESFQNCSKAELQQGDVLLAIVGQGSINKCNVFDNPTSWRFIFTRALGLLRTKRDKLDPYFLKAFLQSSAGRGYVDSGIGGTSGQQVVTTTHLKNIKIPLPSIKEQQRIVTILDEAFAGIATATANAEKNLQNARELFESTLQSVFAEKGDGWEERRLGDSSLLVIVDGDRGVNYPKKDDFFPEGHCLFLNTKNVRPDGFDFDETMFITEEKDSALRKGKLKRNDVIMTTRGTLGNLAVYDDSVDYEHVRINSGMLIFRPKLEKLLPAYLFEVLRSGIIKSQIALHSSGAAQPQLPIKTLVNFTFPVPNTLKEQESIVNRLKEMSGKVKELEAIYKQKLNELAELKQSILQKAFAGELQ